MEELGGGAGTQETWGISSTGSMEENPHGCGRIVGAPTLISTLRFQTSVPQNVMIFGNIVTET